MASPVPAQPAGSAEGKPRGIWFWSKPSSPDGAVNIVGQPAREDEALALFRRWNIRRVYGSYADLPEKSADAVAAWNRKLHAAGIRSEALLADGKALEVANRADFLATVERRVLQFNLARPAAAERFDGLALDIEPHAQPEWKKATAVEKRRRLEHYVALCLALRAHLDAQGGRELAVSAALAYWYHRLPPAGSVAWTSAADRDAWFERLAGAVASISLMAYERSQPAAIADATAWPRAHFKGRVILALRARLGVEWGSLADLTAAIPAVESLQAVGIDIENYELLHRAEGKPGGP